jgi:adenylate cyclase
MTVRDNAQAAGQTSAPPEPGAQPPTAESAGPRPPASAGEQIEEALLCGPRRFTRAQTASAAGVSLERAERIWVALGFAEVDDDAVVFTDGDVQALRAWDSLISSGKIPAEGEVPNVRAIGQTMSRLADWQVREMITRLAEDPGLDDAGRAAGAAERIETLLPVLERLLAYTWRRHLAAAAGRILAASPDELSTATVVVGFADIVGYTSTVRHSDIDELAALLESFEENAAEAIVTGHGRVVKSLGDEVLFTADTARDAAAIAVRLSDPARPARQLPQLRVGMALGRVLTRFGDVYGPAVNLASRLTSLAKPGSVLVDRELAEALRGDDDYLLRPRRPASVRGYHHLRSWSLRRRAA